MRRLGLLLAGIVGCVQPPDAQFRCEPDEPRCPPGMICQRIESQDYCVLADGGSAGGASGGSAGGASGGSAGGTSGGSAGGMSGGSAGGTSGGSAGGTSGGSAGGRSGGSAGGMSGGSAGGMSGGSAGGMSGGSAGGMGGSGMGGGSTLDGGFVALPGDRPGIMFLGSRFTHVSRTGGPDAGTAAITIREALLADGGVAPGVTLNAWTATMQRRFSRELTWKAHQAACSGDYSLCALLGRDTATQLTNFEPQFDLQTPGMPFSLGAASKSRMRILDGITVSPIITWLERPTSANLVRLGVNQAMALSSTTGVPEADDVLALANGEILITARCTSRCTFGSQTDMLTVGTISHFTGRATAPPMAMSFTNVPAGFRNEPDFLTSAPIRLGYNGSGMVTLAGASAPGPRLRIEQRMTNLSLVASFVSTNEMRVIDVAQGASSQSVLILAENNRPNTLNGMTVPHSMGNGPNVVLIRVTAGTFLGFTTFDLPGVQQAVGLAGVSAGASNRVFIAVNEGTTAQLWDVPEP